MGMVRRPGPDSGPGITASEGRGQPRITVPVRARRRPGRDVRVTIMASSLRRSRPGIRDLSGPARGPEDRRYPPTYLLL